MKKTLLFLLFISPLFAFAQKSGYQIIVRVPELKDTTCYLANYYGDKQYIQDTVRSDHNGTAVFQGATALPGGIYLFVYPDKRYFEMIVDKEQHFMMETTAADPINQMKVKGSKENEWFYDYLRQAVSLQRNSMQLSEQYKTAKTKSDSTAIMDEIKAIDKKLTEYREQFIKDHPETFVAKVFITMPDPVITVDAPTLPDGTKDSLYAYRYFRAHYLDNVDFTDRRLLRTPIFYSKLKRYEQDLTPQTPDSVIVAADMLVEMARPDSEMFKYVVWWLTYTSENSKQMGMDEVFVHMVEKYYMTGQAFWMDSAALAKITDKARKIAPNLIGNTAPEIALRDTSGQWQILSKVPAKYTVLVFWDPDCGHCQKEIPRLKEVYDKWKNKGVQVYAIDIEMDEAKWKKFIREKNLDWINVNDIQHTSNFRQLYDVYSTPVIYILDKNKKIVAKRIDAETVDTLLERFSKDESNSR